MSEVLDHPPAGVTPVVAPAPKRDLILPPARMNLAEQWRQDWVVNAEAGTTIDDVLQPSYWSHMAAQLQQYDHIEVRLETGEWVLDLLVTDVGRNFARVYLKQQYDLAAIPAQAAPEAKHRVVFLGPQRKHAVVRIADNAALQEGFSKKTEAQAWLDNHENVTSKT